MENILTDRAVEAAKPSEKPSKLRDGVDYSFSYTLQRLRTKRSNIFEFSFDLLEPATCLLSVVTIALTVGAVVGIGSGILH